MIEGRGAHRQQLRPSGRTLGSASAESKSAGVHLRTDRKPAGPPVLVWEMCRDSDTVRKLGSDLQLAAEHCGVSLQTRMRFGSVREESLTRQTP